MLSNKSLQFLFVFLMGFSVVMITGCQGCRDDSQKSAEEKEKEEAEKKEKEKEEQKPNLEVEPAVFFPGQYNEPLRRNRTKHGHWVSIDYRVKVNKTDVQGELTANSVRQLDPLPIENSDYFAQASRPFSVAKAEQKNLNTHVYLPHRTGATANVQFRLDSSSNAAVFSDIQSASTLRPYQYHMVVLTNRPDNFSYFQLMDSIRLINPSPGAPDLSFYHVVRTNPQLEPISLPRHLMFWTTIAYLVWDDLEADQLDSDQQQALLDWLHFGGQLILSGPDCLDKLANSFLKDYLPATVTATRNFNDDDFAAVNQHWEVKDPQLTVTRKLSITKNAPVIGVDFDLHPEANYVPNTGKIVAERALGRGRIAVTAFSMDDRAIVDWQSYPSFFNGSLLRKPARQFGESPQSALAFSYLTDPTSIFDPLLGSTLRFLSRDLAYWGNDAPRGTRRLAGIQPEMITGFNFNSASEATGVTNISGMNLLEDYRITTAPTSQQRNLSDDWHYGGFDHNDQSGTGGWSDNSGISAAARKSLQKAAGISPPSSSFVLKMLSVYLLILVPVNWFVFWMIGRVECAWIVAPVIAIASGIMVVRLAALDIGFVRSNSEVSCLEIHSDYPRAHLSQYSALYTSLSTAYDMEFENESVLALPMGDPKRDRSEKTLQKATIRQSVNSRLEDFQVQSNSTGLLHSEMMYDLKGVFSLDKSSKAWSVSNDTAVEVQEAVVFRRTEQGEMQTAWVGELPAYSDTEMLEFTTIVDFSDAWQQSDQPAFEDKAAKYWGLLEGTLQNNGSGKDRVDLESIKANVPQLQARWPEFLRNARALNGEADDSDFIDYSTFRQIVERLDHSKTISVAPMLEQVVGNLSLANGEARLIGISDQNLTGNRLEPASTQNQHQTLVVVHLTRPNFGVAKPDRNTLADVADVRGDAFSNLDGDREFELEDSPNQ